MSFSGNGVEPEVLILRPSRLKMSLLLLGSLAFIWASIQMGGWLGLLGTVFCGIGSICFALLLLPGAGYLEITPQGFIVCVFFRKHPLVAWDEVSNFRVIAVPPTGYKIVGYDSTNVQMQKVRKFNRSFVGASDGLPDSYGMKPAELADLLNARRHAAVEGNPLK